MSKPSPAAGGIFLVIAIIAGFAFGVTQGDPLGWSLVGTVIGAVAALILWAVDRRRIGR